MAHHGRPSVRELFVQDWPGHWRVVLRRKDPRRIPLERADSGEGDGVPERGLRSTVQPGHVPPTALARSRPGSRPSLPSGSFAADEGKMVAADAGEADALNRLEGAVDAGRPMCDGGVRMPIDDLDIEEELALKESAIDEAPVSITISDPDRPDNPMIYINNAFEEMTGYEKESVVGRNCRFLQGPDSDSATVRKMREAIDAGESVSVELLNYRKNGEPFWNRVDIAPVQGEDGEVTNFVGFQTDVTDRKEAEMAAKREREKLEHLLTRIDGLVQDVTRELVQAGSRAAVQTAVCDRVTAVDSYEFAWIAAPELSSETLVAKASAGALDPSDDELGRDIENQDSDPTVAAYRSGETHIVRDEASLSAVATAEAWLNADLLRGVAAIPLTYDETVYGVLTLYTSDQTALSEHETVVLEALGRATGTAINALERGRLLVTDSVTELDFRTRDGDLFFVDLSARTGCALEYGGSVYGDDGSVVMFFTTDLDPERAVDVAESHPTIDAAAPLHEHEDATLFEFHVSEASLTATLAERGVRIRSIWVSDGDARVAVGLPDGGDARAIAELLKERYPEMEIAGRREREQPPDTKRGFLSTLEERLTERQLTALQKAHLAGYYEWNRSITGEELAASMDIDRSTYHQHLRAAERKLVEAFFER